MSASAISGPALLRATLLGTVLQTAMVVAGHSLPIVAQLFAVLGVSLSLVAGAIYALWAAPAATRAGAVGGALAGGVCTLIGIATSVAPGDVLAAVLGFGTRSSAVAGAVGGAAGAAIER
ncbi:hypothetical protein BH23GEM7_BH23GEM7_32240 [soil metagenome]